MSLLSIDITKKRRLSLREVRLPAPARKVEPGPPPPVEAPPTGEEIVYSRLVSKNPTLDLLVGKLGLVSQETGHKIRKVDYPVETTPEAILKLSEEVLPGENNYSRLEIISRIIEDTGVSSEKAQEGFIMMLETGSLEQTINPERYYLRGSTPF
jgi:hypothetical protein